MPEVLKTTSTPVWAATSIMSSQLTALRLAYSTFLTVEASIQGIITRPPTSGTHSGMDGMSTNTKDLEAQDWAFRLTKAGKELTKVCRSAHILPLPLLQHAKTRACSGGSIISQYKTVLSDLHLPQGAIGVVMNHTVQPPPQTITTTNSFSSRDRITLHPEH